jgi:hypothetical protein
MNFETEEGQRTMTCHFTYIPYPPIYPPSNNIENGKKERKKG